MTVSIEKRMDFAEPAEKVRQGQELHKRRTCFSTFFHSTPKGGLLSM
jgi:hypothetical protein